MRYASELTWCGCGIMDCQRETYHIRQASAQQLCTGGYGDGERKEMFLPNLE